jgi:hypothetical protein
MSLSAYSQVRRTNLDLKVHFEANTLIDPTNPFHILTGVVLPAPQPVPPRPIRKSYTQLDLSAIKKKIPSEFVHPDDLVKSAFFLMLKMNESDEHSVNGPIFRDSGNHWNTVAAWNDLDMIVISHDGARGTPDSIKFPKVTCLTIYSRLLEMLPRLQGHFDIAAYFPVDGTVFTNTVDGQYTAIVKREGEKQIRLPLLDKKVTERFLSIPVESVIVMTFAYRVTDALINASLRDGLRDGCSLVADIVGLLRSHKLSASVSFTSPGKTLRKWQKIAPGDTHEVFAQLKIDLYRCARFPGPVAETHICLNIFCNCKKNLWVMLDHEHIPYLAKVCDESEHPHTGSWDFVYFTASLDLTEKIAKAHGFAYEVYHPSGRKTVRNKGARSINNYFDMKRGLMAALDEAEVKALSQLLKDMYTVVVRGSTTDVCNAFVDQVLKEGSKSPLQPYYSHLTSMIVNHVDKAINAEKMVLVLQDDKPLPKPTRQELIELVEDKCDDEFMVSHQTVLFISQTLNWLRDTNCVGFLWRMMKSTAPMQISRTQIVSSAPPEDGEPLGHLVQVNRDELAAEDSLYLDDEKGGVMGPFYFPGQYVPEEHRHKVFSFEEKEQTQEQKQGQEQKVITDLVPIPDHIDVNDPKAIRDYVFSNIENLPLSSNHQMVVTEAHIPDHIDVNDPEAVKEYVLANIDSLSSLEPQSPKKTALVDELD